MDIFWKWLYTVSKSLHLHIYWWDSVCSRRHFSRQILSADLPSSSKSPCVKSSTPSLKFIAEHPQCKWFDQDIFNYCFASDYIILEKDFNSFVDNERVFDKSSTIKNYIFHYTGASIHPDMHERFNRLWFKYFAIFSYCSCVIFIIIFYQLKLSNTIEWTRPNFS